MNLEEDREGNVLKRWVVSVALWFECSMKAYWSKWTRGFCSQRSAGSSVPSRLTPLRLLDQATALCRRFASCGGGGPGRNGKAKPLSCPSTQTFEAPRCAGSRLLGHCTLAAADGDGPWIKSKDTSDLTTERHDSVP